MIENSFGKVVEYNSPLCLYVELTAFVIDKEKLSKEIQQQIENMLKESEKVKKAFDLIETNAKLDAIVTVNEFFSVFQFAPVLMSLLNFVLLDEISPPQSVIDYNTTKFALYKKHFF